MSASVDERLTAFFRADQGLIADPFELYRELLSLLHRAGNDRELLTLSDKLINENNRKDFWIFQHRGMAYAGLKDIPKAPGSLEEAVGNLKKDHAFLLKGDVFTSEVISTWLDYKRANEVDAIRLRPHPYEFGLYFDN